MMSTQIHNILECVEERVVTGPYTWMRRNENVYVGRYIAVDYERLDVPITGMSLAFSSSLATNSSSKHRDTDSVWMGRGTVEAGSIDYGGASGVPVTQ